MAEEVYKAKIIGRYRKKEDSSKIIGYRVRILTSPHEALIGRSVRLYADDAKLILEGLTGEVNYSSPLMTEYVGKYKPELVNGKPKPSGLEISLEDPEDLQD